MRHIDDTIAYIYDEFNIINLQLNWIVWKQKTNNQRGDMGANFRVFLFAVEKKRKFHVSSLLHFDHYCYKEGLLFMMQSLRRWTALFTMLHLQTEEKKNGFALISTVCHMTQGKTEWLNW